MRLYWSSRSPFVRKVMVVAHEAGLADRIETERVVVAADRPNAAVMGANPLNKIPTLQLDGGGALYDSRVICEYLDGMGDGPTLFPQGEDRWTALRLQALGDGLMELNVSRLGERNRPPELRSATHQAAFARKIAAVLDQLETEAPISLHIGALAVGCALAHLDFRFGDDAWRDGRPALAAWFERIGHRPSFVATAFKDEY